MWVHGDEQCRLTSTPGKGLGNHDARAIYKSYWSQDKLNPGQKIFYFPMGTRQFDPPVGGVLTMAERPLLCNFLGSTLKKPERGYLAEYLSKGDGVCVIPRPPVLSLSPSPSLSLSLPPSVPLL
eukprot:TRINITY_DN13917_c0_g1_i1.p3 TRINITY_DN13917_c0_g1~~TRINITY_DN13917_c0_g1_i1.p3  ORF type:complete len:138 (-),score=30.73 TRINITY_DN13917_c0_g1_i1:1095-1466(-)